MLKFVAKTENQRLILSEDSKKNCGKVDKKLCWNKIAIRDFTKIINLSRAVLFPKENNEKSNESVIAGQERTLIGQADE